MMKYILFILTAFLLTSCSSGYYMKRGFKMYESGRYYKAGTKYEKAFNKTSSKSERQASMAMRIGQCYQDINKQQEAYNWYRKASRSNKELKEAYLKMAEVSINRGNIETAEEIYVQFNEQYPEEERGKDGLYLLELIRNGMEKEGRYVVELEKELNSRDHDFAPAFDPGDNHFIYFTSTRRTGAKKNRKKDPVTGDPFTQIFSSEYTQEIRKKDKNGVMKVVRHFPEPRWLVPELAADSLRSKRNDGAVCFSADGRTMYFTSSRQIKGKHLGTRIYKATKSKTENDDKETWSTIAPSGICGDSVSVGHPAMSPDGTRLYFVTDLLPGGKGGKDIWYVELENGSFGEPQNAGDIINTEGDELFPYVRDNGELYFASNGHGGFGGLDLYKVTEVDETLQLHHLPAPINSSSDDFGISFRTGNEEGVFSSSRSKRSDNIYRFSYVHQQLNLRLLARNNITERGIPDVKIQLTGDDGSSSSFVSDSLGYMVMKLEPDKAYVFTTEHPDYLIAKVEVSTYREKGDRLYELSLDMQPIEKPIVIPNIYFDVAKWDLREDAMKNLSELLTILKDNPNITIELSAHTDMVGNAAANMLLSERRASSVVDYLIAKGINWDRLVAKGYGKTRPREINEREAKRYTFLKEGDILNEKFIARLKGSQREEALQLNRRIEFKVLTTNYKPGPNSLINPNKEALSAEDTKKIGETTIKDLKGVKGKFYTLQLGVFKNIPTIIHNFRVVFTERLNNGTVRYCTGIYEVRKEAETAAAELKKKGIESIVKEFNH